MALYNYLCLLYFNLNIRKNSVQELQPVNCSPFEREHISVLLLHTYVFVDRAAKRAGMWFVYHEVHICRLSQNAPECVWRLCSTEEFRRSISTMLSSTCVTQYWIKPQRGYHEKRQAGILILGREWENGSAGGKGGVIAELCKFCDLAGTMHCL